MKKKMTRGPGAADKQIRRPVRQERAFCYVLRSKKAARQEGGAAVAKGDGFFSTYSFIRSDGHVGRGEKK